MYKIDPKSWKADMPAFREKTAAFYAGELKKNDYKGFSGLYGSMTAIILVMLWLYFCICILFMGAEINWWWEFHAPSRNWSLAHCPHK